MIERVGESPGLRAPPLREKELRIALVCFGGVSLAVYMHGISKEILKLVRASSALHRDRRPHRACQSRRSSTSVDRNDPEYDTEHVYFELLREIGRSVELRVVVDIIAGASAGGINGTMLARALSHDLPMERCATCGSTMPTSRCCCRPTRAPAPGASGSSSRSSGRGEDRHAAARSRTWRSARSCRCSCARAGSGRRSTAGSWRPDVRRGHRRWGRRSTSGASLLPSGHSLDLFVTLTDFYGYQQLVQIHDPPLIHELRSSPRPALHLSAAIRTARSKAISIWTMRRRSPLRRARPRRFRAPFRRRGSSRWTRSCRAAAGRLAAARASSSPKSFEHHLRAGVDPAIAPLHRRRGAQQPAVPAGDLGDPWPAGLPAGRPAAGLYRAASGAAGDAARRQRCRASSRPCAARCRTSRARSR